MDRTSQGYRQAVDRALREGGPGVNAINELLRRTGQGDGLDLGLFGGGHRDDETGGGAAAAAGVLTAVDEDEEGAEEAKVPDDFEYFTEGEDEE